MMDREVDASTEIKFDGVKAKRKLQKIQLNIPEQIQAELPLTFNQEISNYQAQLSAKKAEVNSSRSSVKGFPKDQFKDFDFEGQYYCIRGRNNGKAMQDKCVVIPQFKVAEDCSFYAVYDGHSTDMISEMLKDRLHYYVIDSFLKHKSMSQAFIEGFENIEKEAIAKLKQDQQLGGSTALCAMIREEKIYIANVGDSRAVVVGTFGAKTLNNLHDFSNPNEEKAVDERGGVIIERGVFKRLQGELAISRSIGDFNYKDYISSAPEITEYQLTSSDNFLILATDGFWNVISPEATAETIKLIQNEFEEFNSTERISEYLIELACNKKQNFKKDNMTLITIDLKKLAEKNALRNERYLADLV